MLLQSIGDNKGIARQFFNFNEDDREWVNQIESKVELSILNPVMLAVKCRSLNCLKFLVDKYDIRPSIIQTDILLHSPSSLATGEFPFKQWLIPVLLKTQDPHSLSFLMN